MFMESIASRPSFTEKNINIEDTIDSDGRGEIWLRINEFSLLE